MSWELRSLEHLRMEYVLIAQEPNVNISELCRSFGISRRTGYKWMQRYREEGLPGLYERSRRPHKIVNAVIGGIVVDLVRLRRDHPHWGPKKLRVLLEREGKHRGEIPSLATVSRILRSAGLSEAKGRGRRRRQAVVSKLTEGTYPNHVWTVDFKGWWRCGDGERCEPLTVRDLYSRYLLCVRPLRKRDTIAVRSVFEELFQRYGLPTVIRSDNGAPFASTSGPCGLTRLSAWWHSLGIALDRIKPGHPEQNGSHERMHGDMARELERHPSATLEAETRRLESWRRDYNQCRPHESLCLRTPGECYRISRNRLESVRAYEYPPSMEQRLVHTNGYIKLAGGIVFLSEALIGYHVGLEPVGDRCWKVWFCDLLIGEIDMAKGQRLQPSAETSGKTI